MATASHHEAPTPPIDGAAVVGSLTYRETIFGIPHFDIGTAWHLHRPRVKSQSRINNLVRAVQRNSFRLGRDYERGIWRNRVEELQHELDKLKGER